MTLITFWLLHHLAFFLTGKLSLAGAPLLLGGAIASTLAGGEGAGDAGAEGDAGFDGFDTQNDGDRSSGGGDDAADGDELGSDQSGQAVDETRTRESREEPELAEFKGPVEARLRALAKRAPGLAQDFQKDPKLRDEIAAVFRREAAFRDVMPTVAEARQLRDKFPNGLADVQALEEEVAETQQLDKDLYSRDREGNFPRHAQLISNMFQGNREATVSLFKSVPREWARLDRDSYNEVMGQIVGATLGQSRAVEDLADALESKDAKRIEASAAKLLNWADRFTQEKPRPTPEAERLQRERADFNKERATRSTEDAQRFDRSLNAEAGKVQIGIIHAHPAVAKLLASKTVPAEKKDAIVKQVHEAMRQLLLKSPSVKKQLKAAYEGRDLPALLSLHKSAWSQPWLLNRMVGRVFNKEIPLLVSQNRESARRRTGAPAGKAPVKAGDQRTQEAKHTRPYQQGKNWFWPDGRRMSTEDILRGKHEQ